MAVMDNDPSSTERGRAESVCIICGTSFLAPRSWLRAGYGKMCGPGCREAWKLKRRSATGVPFDAARKHLLEMEPAVWEAVPPRTREIVRLYYGLHDGNPWTQLAIAEHLSMRKMRVQQILARQTTRRLIGAQTPVELRAEPRRIVKVCRRCGIEYQGATRSKFCSARCQQRADYAAHAEGRRAAKRAQHRAKRAAALELAAVQPPPEPVSQCTDHHCDGCVICRRGLCCRGDNPAKAVKLGEWDGPIYGELGVLDVDGNRVQCHCCGAWYVQLGVHAVQAHGLKAEIYKIIFGLNDTTGLAGEGYRGRMRTHAERVLAPYWPQAAENLAAITAEQREAFDRSKRLEARKDPNNRAAWAKGAHRGGAKIHELYEAGKYLPPLVRDPKLVERQRQLMREKAADPVFWAALVRRLSKGLREGPKFVEQSCVVCGTRFQTLAALVRAGQGKTCGPACYRARRAQALREHSPARTEPEAWRERTRLSARAQWQCSPRYRRIAAALQALEPGVMAGAPELDRQIVGWYYGLEGQRGLDYGEIAVQLGLSRSQVADRLHRLLARLLGGEVVHGDGDRGGTTYARCRVCRTFAQQV